MCFVFFRKVYYLNIDVNQIIIANFFHFLIVIVIIISLYLFSVYFSLTISICIYIYNMYKFLLTIYVK